MSTLPPDMAAETLERPAAQDGGVWRTWGAPQQQGRDSACKRHRSSPSTWRTPEGLVTAGNSAQRHQDYRPCVFKDGMQAQDTRGVHRQAALRAGGSGLSPPPRSITAADQIMLPPPKFTGKALTPTCVHSEMHW